MPAHRQSTCGVSLVNLDLAKGSGILTNNSVPVPVHPEPVAPGKDPATVKVPGNSKRIRGVWLWTLRTTAPLGINSIDIKYRLYITDNYTYFILKRLVDSYIGGRFARLHAILPGGVSPAIIKQVPALVSFAQGQQAKA